MAFDINQFNSQLNYHGIAKTNLFVVTISLPSKLRFIENYITSRDLTFLCRQVTIPGIDINTLSINNYSVGIAERRVTGLNDYEIVPMTFIMDSRFNVLKFFHRWTQAIVNHDTTAGLVSLMPDTNHMAYEVGYKSDYAATITIEIYSGNSPFGGKYIYTLKNAYPINISSMIENWEDTSSLMTLNVSMTYDGLGVDGTSKGAAIDAPVNRVYNLINDIRSVSTLSSLIPNVNTRNTLQTYIDRITSLGTIDNIF